MKIANDKYQVICKLQYKLQYDVVYHSDYWYTMIDAILVSVIKITTLVLNYSKCDLCLINPHL